MADDFGRIERAMADSLGLDRIVSATIPPPPTGAEVLANVKDALRSLRRTVICQPEHVEGLRAAIEDEGLTGSVKVFGDEYIPPGRIYVYRGWPDA
jgi:hypothetical protein